MNDETKTETAPQIPTVSPDIRFSLLHARLDDLSDSFLLLGICLIMLSCVVCILFFLVRSAN